MLYVQGNEPHDLVKIVEVKWADRIKKEEKKILRNLNAEFVEDFTEWIGLCITMKKFVLSRNSERSDFINLVNKERTNGIRRLLVQPPLVNIDTSRKFLATSSHLLGAAHGIALFFQFDAQAHGLFLFLRAHNY